MVGKTCSATSKEAANLCNPILYSVRRPKIECKCKPNWAGLGNTRGIVLQCNSGLTELQRIGQYINLEENLSSQQEAGKEVINT